ncbi:TonB-linked outer membrane protein, SusC/RagA family [Parapedobacter composti]|uniref:TonB-linked outer membrane protein, SusC/RagA family n=1 Tax=Parapedobacter composti TaxID=623281 RepID=A0A1I1K9V0_9SPHI|nr:SusC/RagA family TonB-linked outer membrane protein [Parapedobacter composti]SFC54863.1 TonB-linked outer membrane protein, SusC/RagA family [Parapedobacter composti]
MKEIRKQTGYNFLYEKGYLDKAKPVSIAVNEASLEDALKLAFKGQPFDYKILNKIIYLIPARNQTEQQVPALQTTVQGKVTDEGGKPLTGATIYVPATQQQATSNALGEFSIPNVPTDAVLRISYVGYTSREVKASDSFLTIALEISWQTLDDVEIRVAYGTQTKESFTGSATTVKAEQLESRPRVTFMESLQGNVPGLIATSGSGAPGAFPNVRIRGIGSHQAGNTPLYVVDGIPIVTGNIGSIATSSTAQALINPNDIESVTVLKDASATSIYGSRAANGVILITTKSGQSGRSRINASIQRGISRIMAEDRMRPLNTNEMIELLAEGVINSSDIRIDNHDDAVQYLIAQGINPDVDTDWYDLLTRTGNYAQYNVSASGGNDKSTYYTSLGYYDEEGTTLGNGYQRMTGRLSLTNQLTQRLKLDAGLSAGYQNLNTPPNGNFFVNPVYSMYRIQPWLRAYNDDGTYNEGISNTFNPVAITNENIYDSRFYNLKGNIGAQLDIWNGIAFESRANIDMNFADEFRYDNPMFGDARNDNGRGRNYNVRHHTWNVYNILKYNKQFSEIGIDATLGQEAQRFDRKTVNTYARNYTAPNKYPLANASVPAAADSYEYARAYAAYFLNTNFNYQQKYYLSASIRRDGVSTFGRNNRYGNFWSIGIGWNIHQEPFMQAYTWIDQLKLRSSYGVNGNEAGGYYPHLGLYAVGQDYNGEPGFGLSQIENDNLVWEKNKPFDIGTDFSFFNGRLSGSFDYYVRTTQDLLFSVEVSRTNGITTYDDNIGSFKNSGIELELAGTIVKSYKTGGFNWHSALNFSTLNNTILKLADDMPILSGNFRRDVGRDYYSYYLRGYAGVHPQTGEALYWTDGTKTATTNSYADAMPFYQGSALPSHFGGLTNTFSYKGLSLSFQLYYNWGNKLFGGFTNLFTDGSAGAADFRALPRLTYNTRWRQPGDDAFSPKIVFRGTQSGLSGEQNSTRFMYDGGYIRLRDVTLRYDLPLKKLNLPVSRSSVYFRANNLWTWIRDPYLPRDPESFVGGGIGTSDAPMARQMLIGLDIQF